MTTPIVLGAKKQWPHDTAGAAMTTKVPVVLLSSTIGESYELITSHITDYNTINYLYIVDNEMRLRGVISIKDLFRLPKNTPIAKILKKTLVKIAPQASASLAAHKTIKHNIKAIPVTSRDGVLLGVVPSDVIHRILKKEMDQMLAHFAGISHEHEDTFDNILETPVLLTYKKRIPWLLLGLLGGIFLASIIGFFETTLRENIILAGFIPVITYISNAVAIQVQILFIRDMVLMEQLPYRRYIAKQLWISLLIALTSGSLLLLTSVFGWASNAILFTIAVAMVASIMMAASLSLAVPYALKRLGVDPAIASGPFATILQDISGIIIYFLIASALL